jgi:hypothetical protein
VIRDRLYRLAVCLHLRRPKILDMRWALIKPEDVPKGQTACEADFCKNCDRLIILRTGEWVHGDGKVVHCAERETVAEPTREHYITEAGR